MAKVKTIIKSILFVVIVTGLLIFIFSGEDSEEIDTTTPDIPDVENEETQGEEDGNDNEENDEPEGGEGDQTAPPHPHRRK